MRSSSTARRPVHADHDDLVQHYPEFSRLLIARLNQIIPLQTAARANLDEQVLTSPGDDADASVVDTSADYFLRLANDHQIEMQEIRAAMDRIQKGTYGMCESCDLPIALDRLRRIPTARLCIECQTASEKTNLVAYPGARPKF